MRAQNGTNNGNVASGTTDSNAVAISIDAILSTLKGKGYPVQLTAADVAPTATVAKQVSEDPLAADGGDLGEIEPSKLLPEFEGPLTKMKEGEISEPIRTKVGVHLLKLEKRITEAFQPESEVAAEIKEKLYNEALDERYRRWIVEDIQQHHYIETKL
jgi:peptidyl-prolyl cis-trans isomerase SurA